MRRWHCAAERIPGAGEWRLVAIQGLHRFYRGRSRDAVASWMTREDRELADRRLSPTYVAAVVEAVSSEWAGRRASCVCRLLAQERGDGLSRLACASARSVGGVISLGGDVPPEFDPGWRSARTPAALVGRGSRDEWYTPCRRARDRRASRLREAGVAVTVVTLDAPDAERDGAAAPRPRRTSSSVFRDDAAQPLGDRLLHVETHLGLTRTTAWRP